MWTRNCLSNSPAYISYWTNCPEPVKNKYQLQKQAVQVPQQCIHRFISTACPFTEYDILSWRITIFFHNHFSMQFSHLYWQAGLGFTLKPLSVCFHVLKLLKLTVTHNVFQTSGAFADLPCFYRRASEHQNMNYIVIIRRKYPQFHIVSMRIAVPVLWLV